VSTPWLSVIVPTYNGAAFLRDALESVCAQGDAALEVIAVDDGSTDATLAILADYARRLPLTALTRRVGNWAANTNLGLERARGEWACLLHQDDLWRPGRLAATRRALAAGPAPALLLHAADFIDPAGRTVGRWRCPLPPGRGGSAPQQTAARLLVQNFVPLPAALFRRADALRVGGLDPGLWFTPDWDFWLKLAACGPTRYLPAALAAFRLHPASQTVTRSGRSAAFRRQYEVVRDKHWDRWRGRLAAPRRVAAASRLAVEVNVALAARHHGEPVDWRRLLAAAGVGPGTWGYFLRNSRVVERVLARLRAGLAGRRQSA
jgi:GT2 family glycosyltransferase